MIRKQLPSILLSIASLTVAIVFIIADHFTWERLAVGILVAALPWCGHPARTVALAFTPLWLAAVVVDAQRFLPLLGPVHTGDFYAAELSLFHIGGQTVTEWLYAHPVVALDIACGAAYALFLWFYLALCIEFFIRERERLPALVWAFFTANTVGAIIYVLFPVAPPWYVIANGIGPANMSALGSAAGCARFDAIFGIHYFEAFYARNPNVFGAMPSLHVALPFIMTLATWHRGTAWRVVTVGFTALVAFSAAYLAHHYIFDIIAGFAVGWLSYALAYRFAVSRTQAADTVPHIETSLQSV